MTVFGKPWDELDLETLEAFLADAEREPLVWEAKGTAVDRHDVRENVCAFGNANEEGYLVLGVSRSGDAWVADGVELPDEAPTWVSNIVRDDVRPSPAVDVREWTVAEGRTVAVVRVPPVSTPPCITRGTVYERVSGATKGVRDPIRLADLYRRGEVARNWAQRTATGAGAAALNRARAFPGWQPEYVQFAIGVARTGHLPDISSRLFTTAVEEMIASQTATLAGVPAPFSVNAFVEWRQDRLTGVTDHPLDRPHMPGVTVTASWDGAVGVSIVWPLEETSIDSLVLRIGQSWETASSLLGGLSATGENYITVLAAGDGFQPLGDATWVEVARGPMPPGVDDRELASLRRELIRSTELRAPEDEA